MAHSTYSIFLLLSYSCLFSLSYFHSIWISSSCKRFRTTIGCVGRKKILLCMRALTVAASFATFSLRDNRQHLYKCVEYTDTHRALKMHFPLIIGILSPPENIKWTLNGTVSHPIFIYMIWLLARSFSRLFVVHLKKNLPICGHFLISFSLRFNLKHKFL